MIIKKVVAQGFKTYAKRTEFIFDPGVTAIVGPNGSGKSNVADAIRWCLGEQSFSLLRSKKTSDVIFSGSDRKSRLGMAQVSVTLDNSNNELPVDFSEVEITRRAYRDGNNEYLLNGQRVRLTDITEILAATGLGKRTYALIGQGLIERVISMAPEDLRSLFEEAAGITTHQTKRSAAMRRLDAADQNLTRVKDITTEISPRLGYLRRQAERAEQRNQLAEQLRDLLEDWYGYHWHQAKRQLKTAGDEAQLLGKRVTKLRSELENLSQLIENKRKDQAQLRSELSDLHRESSQRHRDAEQNGRELAVAQERFRQVMERIEANRQELVPLRLQQQTLRERIAQAEVTLTELRKKLAARKENVDALQTTINQRQQSQRHLEEEVTRQRENTATLRSAISHAQSRAEQLDTRYHELQAELQTELTARQVSADQAIELHNKVESCNIRLKDAEAKTSLEQSKIDSAETEIDNLRAQLEEATIRRQHADRELDRLQTRFDVLNRLRREGAGYASGVQAIIMAAHKKQLHGIIGTVASLLKVPAHLDTAIETALGGSYQNIVTTTWEAAQEAIEYLNSSGNGRATFLPLNRLHVLPPIPAPHLPGVIGNACDLVAFPNEGADAIQQLLNRVWVAEDLHNARAALDTISHGPRPTVVTLRGEIVRPGGAVSGGKDARHSSDSVHSRERELRELPEMINEAAQLAMSHAENCRNLVSDIQVVQNRIPSIQDKLHSISKDARIAREEATATDKSLERAAQSRDWHTARINQIEHDLLALEEQQETISADILNGQVQVEAAEQSLREAIRSAEASGVSTVLRQLADLRAAAAETQGDVQSQSAILDNQKRNLQSTESQIATREQQLLSQGKEADTLSESIAQLGTLESELGTAIAQLQAKIGPIEQRLAQMEVNQSQSEAAERSLQDTLRKDEIEWNATLLAAQRAQDTIDQLRRDIELEFGLVFLDETDEESIQPPLPLDEIIRELKPIEELPEALDEDVRRLRRSLGRLKNVNPDAPREYAQAAERCELLETQAADLSAAIADLHEVITTLDALMETELRTTFSAVSEQFVHFFEVLFEGGSAKLSLTNAENITSSAIEIIARPPGKRPQTLALLSGGERTLTACALIFAILRVSPTPFCVLDEVDAALDEANVDRFRFALEELSEDTQFILITHNRRTLEGTNAIYGVTMGSDGTSRVISLKLEGERIVADDSGNASDSSANASTRSEVEEIVEL